MNDPIVLKNARMHESYWDDLLQDAIDSELSDSDSVALNRHLRECERCRDALVQLQNLHSSLQSLFGSTSAPPGFESRLLRKLGMSEAVRGTQWGKYGASRLADRLQRFRKIWQSHCEFDVGSVIAAATMLVSASMFVAGAYASDLPAWSASLFGLKVPSLLVLACGASALVLRAGRSTDRNSSRS